jgi:hypothetical protein
MNPYVQDLAKELAEQLNAKINIPWLNEEQEQLFFELVVTKVFELTIGSLLKHIEKKEPQAG